jgi:ABC-type nitrate/sulfonate/bicarbonate transport system permease component
MRVLSFIGTSLWLPILILALWELSDGSLFFPAPSHILDRAITEVDLDWVVVNLLPTLSVFGFGYLMGLLLGVGIGALVGVNRWIYDSILPVLVFLRKMPSVAKLPIIMAIVGIGLASQITSVVVAVTLLMALVTAKAVSEPDINSQDTAALLLLTKVQRIFLVFLPSRLGILVTSAKSAMQLAFLLTILGETLASAEGVGAYMLRAKSLFDIELMWIGILFVGAIGFVLHETFEALERKLVPLQQERALVE